MFFILSAHVHFLNETNIDSNSHMSASSLSFVKWPSINVIWMTSMWVGVGSVSALSSAPSWSPASCSYLTSITASKMSLSVTVSIPCASCVGLRSLEMSIWFERCSAPVFSSSSNKMMTCFCHDHVQLWSRCFFFSPIFPYPLPPQSPLSLCMITYLAIPLFLFCPFPRTFTTASPTQPGLWLIVTIVAALCHWSLSF